MNGNPRLTIGYIVMGESRKHVEEVWWPNHGLGGPGYKKLSMDVCGMRRVTLVTLVKLKTVKISNGYLARVAIFKAHETMISSGMLTPTFSRRYATLQTSVRSVHGDIHYFSQGK